ncbi:glucose-1-phosphate adenylyltransferase subunit GlgD [Facklamia sp. 7083-14-GEN3]|uniref:glucose-1-phosphate adenylyltransferase subunit GlgD n=1 Tax=Facklamia sp. 7083-14-GEN3 TaxID=2973478 RepID=UPI00215C3B88|nr:glucose-1-phosphate adenylyltransferase subunit GlgD [Facklamia sp. 7083-14-GEN3]MCR8968627.1 glucose-1-phosphate adenylyltransferase subunit GlgD [Facklamia sp. 7083-14-GEN3]
MVHHKTCAILNLTEDNQPLYPLTYNRPIAALPFASRYRIIDFILSSLSYAEVQSVAMFIGESGRSLYDHIRSGASWNLDSRIGGGIFTFSQQNWKARYHRENEHEDYYYNHRIFLERSKANYVFVSGSKIIANININDLRQSHIDSEKDVTLVYKNVIASTIGMDHPNERIVAFDEEKNIVDLLPNSEKPALASVSTSLDMYFLSVDILLNLIDRAEQEEQYLEIDDLIQFYLLDYSIHPYEYTGYTANINSVEAYYQANMDMLNHLSYAALFHTNQPVRTKSKNGIPTYYHERSYVRNAILATGTTVYGEVIDSLINRRVQIGENASVRNSIIQQGVEIGEGATVEYAILDKNVVVKPGTVIRGRPDKLIVKAKNEIVDARVN